MTRTALALPSALLLALLTSPLDASANPFGQAHWSDPYVLTAQIRGQMQVVQAYSREALRHSDEYDDVHDELRDFCERLSRMEEGLRRAQFSHHARNRLRRLAERLDDQACELIEEIEDALEDCREDFRFHQGSHPFGPPVIPAQAIYPASTIRLGGVTVTFGGRNPRIAHAKQTILAGYPQQAGPLLIGPGGGPNALALRSEAQTLRNLTRQLRAAL